MQRVNKLKFVCTTNKPKKEVRWIFELMREKCVRKFNKQPFNDANKI